jgi:Arylsulfotransferase (ASST)
VSVPSRILLAILAAVALAAPADAKLTISPAPGTPDASPQTQISILGVAPGKISSVEATGTATGAHPGVMRPYSGGRGASFLPSQPFAQDERVDAVVNIRGLAPVRFSFTIAHLGPTLPLLRLTARQPDKLQSFVSRPDLQPPKITVRRRSAGVTGGIFITPLPSPVVHPESNNTVTISPVGPGGPMIVDGRGDLVWFSQLESPDVAANLRVQRFRGRPALTWWQGSVTPYAFGIGTGIIADTSYRTIRTVRAGNGYPMDLHEFELAPPRDALFTIYSLIQVHLPGTPEDQLSPLLDSIVQEVDISTGLVVWEWHAYGHIPLEDSYATPQNSASYDAFHINSLQPLPNDHVLVGARDTSAVYEVDRPTGRIVWKLGGKASTFKLGRGARFWFQHDARMLSGNEIGMFDDEAGPPQKAPASRGLILSLDRRRLTARVVREYRRSGHTSAQSEGSLQRLPHGNVFVGFGSTPFFSEFTPAGRLLFDASLPQDDGSYRIVRAPWTATPRTRPDVAARRSGPSSVSVYASWNGATTVARWQVLGGADAASLAPLATARRRGFETKIDVSGPATTFAVRALSARGRIRATSAPVSAT